MAQVPPPINTIQAAIDAHHEAHQESPRPHMGCSLLGHPCDRWLWLSFRWAVIERFSGRMLRLFRRGQNEEQQIVNDLRAIGIDVQSTGAQQSRVDFGCHVSGSIDGIAVRGVPGAEKTPHVLEFKTHSLKSFNDLVAKQSVKESKPQHYAQMQLYMLGKDIDRALYVAVCKDNDEMYTERVKLAPDEAEKLLERGKRIALAERMPEPLSTDPTWYQCKFCSAHDFCHVSHMTQQVNCRTCAHVTPERDSTWTCARHGGTVPVDFQRTGCDDHVLHPDLVPWKMLDSGDPHAALYEIDGVPVRNGRADKETYASSELVANPIACAKPDQVMRDMRAMFGAKVEG